MKISKITAQKRNPDRLNLYIDDEYALSLASGTLVKYKISKGYDMQPKFREILEYDLFQRLYQSGVKYAGKGLKTSQQVYQNLSDKIYRKLSDWYPALADIDTKPIIEDVIERMVRDGYIDDRQYAQAFVRDRVKFKPRSLKLVKSELYAKNIDSQIIDEVLAEFEGNDDESKMLETLLEKKYRSKVIDPRDQKKLRYLAGKGFSWDMISKYMKDI